MSSLNVFTDENFQAEVLESALPVLVDFWGPGCPPCQRLLPVLEQLAADNGGTVKIGKVNTHENMELANRFNIATIPSLFIIKDGEVVRSLGGVVPKDKIQQALDEVKS